MHHSQLATSSHCITEVPLKLPKKTIKCQKVCEKSVRKARMHHKVKLHFSFVGQLSLECNEMAIK